MWTQGRPNPSAKFNSICIPARSVIHFLSRPRSVLLPVADRERGREGGREGAKGRGSKEGSMKKIRKVGKAQREQERKEGE